MPSAWPFSLYQIPVQRRPLKNDLGQPLANPDGSVVGDVADGSGMLIHWLDPALYDGWTAEADQDIAIALAHHDPGALQLTAKAIMKAYNALNIQWWIDPEARALFRVWVAGHPASVGGNTLASDFGSGPGSLYNNSVFLAPDDRRCIIVGGTGWFGTVQSYGGCNSDNGYNNPDANAPIVQFDGLIPRNTRAFFNNFAPGSGAAARVPVQFLPRFQFLVRAPNDASLLPRQYWIGSDPTVPIPFDLGLLKAPALFNDVIWRTASKQFYRKIDGSDASSDPDGWDTWAFDANGSVPQQVRPSYAAYAQYLQQWVAKLTSRTAQQVVQDARAYAIYRNERSQQAAGGTFSSLAGGAIANIDALQGQDPTGRAALLATGAAVATTAAAVGVALSATTFGVSAGVGALIAGAATAITQVGATAVPPNLANVWIDDLERPKPWIERSWLGGDPSDRSMGPPLAIDAPPGWTRPAAIQARGTGLAGLKHRAGIDASILAQAPAQTDLGSMLASVPSWVWWAAGGLVIGGGALYAGSRLTQGTKRRSSRRSTRRSNR